MADSRTRLTLLYWLMAITLLAFLVTGHRLQSQWGDLEPGIVVLELASTPLAAQNVIQEWEEEEPEARSRAREQIRLDFWFIPAYVLASCVWGFWATRWRGRWLLSMKWILLLIPLVAGVLDVIENLSLLTALDSETIQEADTVRASWAAGAKFLLLALGLSAVAVGAWRKTREWITDVEPKQSGTGQKPAKHPTRIQAQWKGLDQRFEVQKKWESLEKRFEVKKKWADLGVEEKWEAGKSSLREPDPEPFTWRQIRDCEKKVIKACREKRKADGPYNKEGDLFGLALSGGGIRSATFNLGLLQALAKAKLLRHVDYLSTVSGGGYIGGWLSRWAQAAGGIVEVERELAEPREHDPDGNPVEPAAVSFLRRYSNYLTPKVGLLTADTWTTIATYGRNLLLNLVILVCSGGAVLLIPRILAGLFDGAPAVGRGVLDPADWPKTCALGAAALVVLAIGFMGRSLALFDASGSRREGPISSALSSQGGVLLSVVAPMAAAAVLATVWLYQQSPLEADAEGPLMWVRSLLVNETLRWSVLFAAGYALAWATAILVAGLSGGLGSLRRYWKLLVLVVMAAVPAGFAGGVAMHALGTGLHAKYQNANENVWYILTAVPPMILVLITLTAVIQIGLMGRSFGDELREWMARVGAWLLITASVWFGLFSLSVFGSVLVSTGPQWLRGIVASGWLAATLTGVLAGNGSTESEGRGKFWRNAAIKITPYIFIVGLVAFLSVGLDAVLSKAAIGEPDDQAHAASRDWDDFWTQEPVSQRDLVLELRDESGSGSASLALESVGSALTWRDLRARLDQHNRLLSDQSQSLEPLLLCLILILLTVVLSRRVDINEFSMHRYYRNRLVRCFLGASNKDRAHQKLTGFDAADDIPLATVAGLAGTEDSDDTSPRVPHAFPYPILNTSLNLVHGDELAWQERKAASFIMTPLFCGFKLPRVGARSPRQRTFRRTRSFSDPGKNPLGQQGTGITLGTAMAISGAAASPNMGFRSSPALTFLLTVFNVRLGWWVGNPTSPYTWRLPGPRLGIFHLIKELFGLTSADSTFSYLSDGGHFENLGIYELARRRCRLIIASDVGTDPKLEFQDLGNAIRKCRTDLGAEIHIDPKVLKADSETGYSGQHCVAGAIIYDDAPPGVLLYIKASLTGSTGGDDNEPADVLQYQSQNREFPHQSTLDQFFSESQFESYRALGQHIGEVALAPVLAKTGKTDWTRLEEKLLARWEP